MKPPVLPRQDTVTKVQHPPIIRPWLGFQKIPGAELHVLDDAVQKPLQEGEPLLNWEGDTNLVLCADYKLKRWVLVRLEFDGKYRVVCGDVCLMSAADYALKIAAELPLMDGRNVNVAKKAIEDNDKMIAARDAQVDEVRLEVAERIVYDAIKEGF